MPLTIDCQCGRRLKAKDEAAGKTVRCPYCREPVTIPQLVVVEENPFDNPMWSRDAEPEVQPKPQEPPKPAEVAWYYYEGGDRQGPINPQVLKSMIESNKITDESLLWREGMAEPKPLGVILGKVKEKSQIPVDPTATKACPFCGEQILQVAKKCKHCGEFLTTELRESRQPQSWNPGVAAFLSLLLPGVGQMYKGQIALGAIQIIGSLFAYGTNLYLGLALHVGTVFHAALAKPQRGSKSKGMDDMTAISIGVVLIFVLGAGLFYFINASTGGR